MSWLIETSWTLPFTSVESFHQKGTGVAVPTYNSRQNTFALVQNVQTGSLQCIPGTDFNAASGTWINSFPTLSACQHIVQEHAHYKKT